MSRSLNSLTVLTGAGASHDCAWSEIAELAPEYQPPLTNQLFEPRGSFNAILHNYPGAEALSDEIRTKLMDRDASLESILKEIESREPLALRKQYWQIPLYLQELLGAVSTQYVRTGGTRYDTLVSSILRSPFERVMFLTLNYDLLLDRALQKLYGVSFSDLSAYCPKERDWSLIKLHGSVNWGRKLQSPKTGVRGHSTLLLNSLSSEPTFETDIEILKGHQEGSRFVGSTFFYPALAIPLGEKRGKDFVCPQDHLDYTVSFLSNCSNFLIIGFSGLDQHILELFQDVQRVDTLKIVNESRDSAIQTMTRIGRKNPRFAPTFPGEQDASLYDKGFGGFVGSGELERFLGN